MFSTQTLKKKEGTKTRPKSVVLLWTKNVLSPQFQAKFCLKGRQKTKPWPFEKSIKSKRKIYRVFGLSTPPKWCDTKPPWYLVSHRHICAIPRFTTYRTIVVRYHLTKTSTKEFGDTIAASIARYEKYRCWASKCSVGLGTPPAGSVGLGTRFHPSHLRPITI